MSTPISQEAREVARRAQEGVPFEYAPGKTVMIPPTEKQMGELVQQAIDASQPALQWTAVPPKVPGWYFYRSHNGIYLWAHRPGDDGTAYRAGLEFAGPVTLPSEPQAKET